MSKWALILGASTGHGGATAISLAEKGYGILGFHFDRGETKKEAEKIIKPAINYLSKNHLKTYLIQNRFIKNLIKKIDAFFLLSSGLISGYLEWYFVLSK